VAWRNIHIVPVIKRKMGDMEGAKGYAVRATQYSLEGASRKTIRGQTFVAGEVEGFTFCSVS
jgi:hypothetical protein